MRIKTIIFTSLTVLVLSQLSFSKNVIMSSEKQQALTPQQVFNELKAGNERFLSGSMKNRDLLYQAKHTAPSQAPMAVILNCMDSRTPPEIIFDKGIGDVFVIRIGGNIENEDILGSMEFGTKIMGARLIAVVGHTGCGAIRGACNQVKLGNLTSLLNRIQPAIQEANNEISDHACAEDKYIDQIAKDNVLLVMQQIIAKSPIIKGLIDEGKLGLVGGIQDLQSGKVTFFTEKNIMPKSQQ